jgi:hypothetical protein
MADVAGRSADAALQSSAVGSFNHFTAVHTGPYPRVGCTAVLLIHKNLKLLIVSGVFKVRAHAILFVYQ